MSWKSIICSVFLLLFAMQTIPVNAEAVSNDSANEPGSEVISSVGLITSYNLVVSKNNGRLCINGSTDAEAIMKKVGFTDIVIERSTNGYSNWSTAYTLDDVLNSDAITCKFNNRLVIVTSGYYYRVSCNHYAKETGWFPRTQSVSNTSNIVYIG